ncbi:TPA: hypothetical protein I7181_08610 [Vibrio vulnificus]|nr:hypothetical protein [Vibrio vulnificus]
MNYKNFKYKSFEGTVFLRSDGKFEGKVIDLIYNNQYSGSSLDELEVQFKNRVDFFYESCTMLGVEPEIIGRVKPRSWPYFILFLCAILVMTGLLWFYAHEFPMSEVASHPTSKLEWFDKSGSFFNNFAAPLLSFFSFMGLLFTIYQQNRSHQLSLKELALTREELELTRKEIEKTTIANEEQAEALRQQVVEAQSAASEQKALAQEQRQATQVQQFETSFYSLLTEHNQALSELIKVAQTDSLHIASVRRSISGQPLKQCLGEIQSNAQLCRYFRMLYQLLKYVATNHVTNLARNFSNDYLSSHVSEEEKRYASLVRSMLPENILGLLAVNCCSGYDSKHSYHKYFLLIQRYSLLEHLNVNTELICQYDGTYMGSAMTSILKNYDCLAFGSNESLLELDKSFDVYLTNDNPQPNNIIFILGKGRKGSAYEKLTNKNIRYDSPFWSVLN